MAEKSEKATPKKLRDARKKGQVAKSKDFPAAFTFVVSIALTLGLSGFLFSEMTGFMVWAFKTIGSTANPLDMVISGITSALMVIFKVSLPIMVVTTIVGMAVSFLITGPVFSLEAMKPDIKKLNPVSNLKNMFKVKTFIELVKSVFKITGALLLIYSVVDTSIDQLIQAAAMPITGSLAIFSSFLLKVIVRVGIFFLIIGIFDLIFQKKNFAKEMKMEKFEVKQEMKDTEGNPEIKGKRRQVAQEIAYQEGPAAVPRARAVITNPIHIAVAIEYNEEEEPAPKIVTMGRGAIADRIVHIAEEHSIPIMRNVELAQTLYKDGTISGFIPEETYEAMAEVLKWLAQLEKGEEEEEKLELFES